MDITMPQLGETVTEGTITRWLKRVGDRVEADEPLFEVSTDKVDSEVPAASAGFLTEIRVPEGETAPVGAVLAVIGDQGDRTVAPPTAEPVTSPQPVVVAPPPAAPSPAAPPPPAAPPSPAAPPPPVSVPAAAVPPPAPAPAPVEPLPARVAPAAARDRPGRERRADLTRGATAHRRARPRPRQHPRHRRRRTHHPQRCPCRRQPTRPRAPRVEPPSPTPPPAAPAAPPPGAGSVRTRARLDSILATSAGAASDD